MRFVAKVSAAGTDLDYCGYIGGADARMVHTVLAVDAAGSAYVCGVTESDETTFPVNDRSRPDVSTMLPDTRMPSWPRSTSDGTVLDLRAAISADPRTNPAMAVGRGQHRVVLTSFGIHRFH